MLLEELESECPDRTAVVGVGDAGAGDGGVGPMVVDMLSKAGVNLVMNGGPSPELDAWRIKDLQPSSVIFVDAVDFGGSPGDISVMRSEEIPEKALDSRGSLLLNRLRSVEERLKVKCFLVAVQPDHVRPGLAMCDEVRYAASRVARSLLDGVFKDGK